MKKIENRITVLVILMALIGCESPGTVKLDNPSRIDVREAVSVYAQQPPDAAYKPLGIIEGISCQSDFGDAPASRDDAIDQLRHRSRNLGGNGVGSVTCEEPRSVWTNTYNCWSSVKCTGMAIQVDPKQGIKDASSSRYSNLPQSVEDVKKGVVKITARVEEKTKIGTGLIVRLDKDAAYIITAAHVVAGDSRPKIEFFTKRNIPVPAEVLGMEGGDEVRGLALLVVVERENLPSQVIQLQLATAVRMSGGEELTVIGFPRGAGPWAVIRGSIVSRRGRELDIAAPIDEGNSGGPIIHNNKVVGLIAGVSHSFGRGVTAASIYEYLEGFGITAKEESLSAEVRAPRYAEQNLLSSFTVVGLDATLRRQFNIPSTVTGLVTHHVEPGSAAATAGLRPGDVITEINGTQVKDLSQYHWLAGKIKGNEVVNLLLNRQGDNVVVVVRP